MVAALAAALRRVLGVDGALLWLERSRRRLRAGSRRGSDPGAATADRGRRGGTVTAPGRPPCSCPAGLEIAAPTGAGRAAPGDLAARAGAGNPGRSPDHGTAAAGDVLFLSADPARPARRPR